VNGGKGEGKKKKNPVRNFFSRQYFFNW